MSTTVKYLICDLDGTLFDISERLKFINKPVKDWESYSKVENIKKDKTYEWCKDLLVAMDKSGYNIIFLSGRMKKEGVERATKIQIDNLGLSKYWLFMRENKDYKLDTELKKELLIEAKKAMYSFEPEFIIDDRQSVVDMWRENGYTCLQCAEGNF